jgi:methyl-accepting chemotaxis protein
MLFFRNLTQFWKFSIFSSLATLLMLVVLIVSYVGFKGTNQRFDHFTDQHQALALIVSEMYTEGLQSEQALRNIILDPDDDKALNNYRKSCAEFLKLHGKAMSIAEKMKEYDKKLGTLPLLWQQGTAIKDEIIGVSREGNQERAIALLVTRETPKWRELKEKILELKSDLNKDMQAAHESLSSYTEGIFYEIMSVLGLTIVLINVIMFVLWRVMQQPMNTMVLRLKDIAAGEGDLTQRLDIQGKDEFAEMAHWFNQFMEKLNRTLSTVRGTTTSLATSAGQLKTTAERIATGAEEVASQSAMIATAVEEMSMTSGSIAQNCQLAAEGSRVAEEAACSGARVVDETIAIMKNITERVTNSAKAVESLGSHSDQIGEIIGTIEDIADQTNLLALNAAIEAARAGEQGRGFAVVADEVRALAERTTKATREISQVIKFIQSKTKGAVSAMEVGVIEVSKGSENAVNCGKALENILVQINGVTEQIHQVATAAEEQSATTAEIGRNMQQITEIVYLTANGAQESAGAAQQLSALSQELRRTVEHFKLA